RSALRAAEPAAADQAAVRQVIERFFAAYAKKDLDAFMALWSPTAPDLDKRRGFMKTIFAETGPITVKDLTVIRTTVDGATAQLRARVELAGNDAKTGKPYADFGKLDRALELAKEETVWKVRRYETAGAVLVRALTSAVTLGERRRLLEADKDLVSAVLVQA